MRTLEDYRLAIIKLFPSGLIWPKTSDESNLVTLVDVIGNAMLTSDNDSLSMLNQLYPDSTGIFLEDFERVMSLPRPGITGQTRQQRRDVVLAWLNVSPTSEKQFFVDIAAVMGFSITVEDYGDDHTLGPFEWRVTSSLSAPVTVFKAGQSKAGDKLVDQGSNEPLESLINFFAPAHTVPIFNYV